MTTLDKLGTFNVEEWDPRNREEGHYLGAGGWTPMGHTHYREDAGRKELAFWHDAHPDAPLRLTQTITEYRVLATHGSEVPNA